MLWWRIVRGGPSEIEQYLFKHGREGKYLNLIQVSACGLASARQAVLEHTFSRWSIAPSSHCTISSHRAIFTRKSICAADLRESRLLGFNQMDI
jgi:hypothetical protein